MTEYVLRIRVAALGLLILTGCGGPPPPPVAPEPEPEPEEIVVEPAPPPQIPVEERIRAPFAVQSDGRVAAREPRRTLVALDPESPRAPAAPDTAAAGTAPRTAPATPAATSPPTPPSAATPPRATTTPSRSAAPRQHTVQAGDTFFGIARRYGVTAAALAAVNPGVDRELLRAGQVLQLPAYATSPGEGERAQNGQRAQPEPPRTQPTPPPAQRPAAQRPAAQRPAAQQRTHRVAAGETLWGIARRYGVAADQIRRANRMTDDVVRIGQTLVIPVE
jgi:membrane-bound lytic murein transglycosylase D